jgi:hypothetical protein
MQNLYRVYRGLDLVWQILFARLILVWIYFFCFFFIYRMLYFQKFATGDSDSEDEKSRLSQKDLEV